MFSSCCHTAPVGRQFSFGGSCQVHLSQQQPSPQQQYSTSASAYKFVPAGQYPPTSDGPEIGRYFSVVIEEKVTTIYQAAQCRLIPLIVTFTLAEIFDLLADTFFWISSFAAPFRLPSSRPCSALATDFSQFALQSSLSDVLRIKKIIFITLIFKCFHIQGS